MSVGRTAAGALRSLGAPPLASRSAEAGTGRSGIGPAIRRGKDRRNSLTTPVFGGSSRQVGIVGQVLGLRSEAICCDAGLCRICDRGLAAVAGVTDFLAGRAAVRLLFERGLLHFPPGPGPSLDWLSPRP